MNDCVPLVNNAATVSVASAHSKQQLRCLFTMWSIYDHDSLCVDYYNSVHNG